MNNQLPQASFAGLVAVLVDNTAFNVESRFGLGDDASQHVLRLALAKTITEHVERVALQVLHGQVEGFDQPRRPTSAAPAILQ